MSKTEHTKIKFVQEYKLIYKKNSKVLFTLYTDDSIQYACDMYLGSLYTDNSHLTLYLHVLGLQLQNSRVTWRKSPGAKFLMPNVWGSFCTHSVVQILIFYPLCITYNPKFSRQVWLIMKIKPKKNFRLKPKCDVTEW